MAVQALEQAHAAIRLQEDELLEHAFHDLPAAAALLDPRLHRRLTEALSVRASGGARYLEHGSTLYPQIGPVSVAA